MGSSKRGVVKQGSAGPGRTFSTDSDAYPITEAVSWTKVPGGWVIAAVTIQGEEIIATELLSPGPESAKDALSRLSVEGAARMSAAVGTKGMRS